MRWRALFAILFLIPIELLERGAYYGVRATLFPWLTSGLGADSAAAVEVVHRMTSVTYGMPFLGALLAIAIGPRFVLAAGALLAAIGLAMLTGAESLPAASTSLLVVGAGGGVMKPCIVAALADSIPDPGETRRNALFIGYYLAINVASFVSTLAAGYAARQNLTVVVFGAAAGTTMLATVLALAFALLWRFWKEPPPPEPGGAERWWRAGLGALLLAALSIPYYLVIDLASMAPFRVATRVEGVSRLLALNPLFVTGTGVLVLAVLLGCMAAGLRARALLLVGIGLAVTSLGAVPMLIAPEARGAVVFSVAVMAAGECVVGSLLLARMVSGHHWRAKAVFGAAAFFAVILVNQHSRFVEMLPPDRQATATTIILVAAIVVTGLAGIVLAAAHLPLSRFFWPETPAASAEPDPGAVPAPAS